MLEPANFEILVTDDGSPSLNCLNSGLSMHNRAGALGETLHVYQPVVDWVQGSGITPRFLSVGLGIGYVEMMVAARYLVAPPDQSLGLTLVSCEKNNLLRRNFCSWVLGTDCDEELACLFHQVADLIGNGFDINSQAIRNWLFVNLERGRWKPVGELCLKSVPNGPFNGVFFDPYAVDGNPELWTSGFFTGLVRELSGDCAIASFAASSGFKRTLTELGFAVQVRPGFGQKRESVFAHRWSSMDL